MHTAMIRNVLIGLAGSVLVVASSAAVAGTVTYKAALAAPAAIDSKATGTAEVTFDTATKTLSWTINFDGLTGPSTMAHFHGPAAAGVNAPPIITMKTLPSPIKGTATMTDAQIAEAAHRQRPRVRLYQDVFTLLADPEAAGPPPGAPRRRLRRTRRPRGPAE